MSYDLATIRLDAPLEFDLEKCRVSDYNFQNLKTYMLKMEFSSLLKRISPEEDQDELEIGEAKTVQNKKELEELMAGIEKEKAFGLDFILKEGGIGGAGLFLPGSKSVFCLTPERLEEFKSVLTDEKKLKIGHDIKKGRPLFFSREEPDDFVKNFFDVKIAAYLLRSGTNNELEKLILEEFGGEIKNKTTKNGQSSLLNDNEETARKESCEKAGWSWKLYERYTRSLEEISKEQKKSGLKGGLEELMQELELPLVEVLAKMEHWGIKTDKKKLKEVSDKAQEKIEVLEKDIYEMAGEEFNINSPSQLAEILYNKLEISTQDIKRGKTGYSTDADQLRKIRHLHPVVSKIENYREFFKLKTTYADALPELVGKDGRTHTTFNQTVTATGRLSSSDPNLQNIPKKGELAELIRSSFVAEEGFELVSIDYSQIDLRVAAHVSGDAKLIEIFQENRDVHRATAAWVNGVKESEVTDKQRGEAKSLNFGILYGMGTYGFMRDSGVDKKRADFFIEQYMKSFSGLKSYLEETKKFAAERGYAETEMGRRRYIPNINSSNFQLKNAAERIAINLPIQGLAADIMKLAMLEVQKELDKNFSSDQARMILQVHDELIFEVEAGTGKDFAEKMKEIMQGVYELKVPLLVEYSLGKSWTEL